MIAIVDIELIIKMFTLHICVYLIFFKITNHKEKNIIVMISASFAAALMHLLLEYLGFSYPARLGMVALSYSVFLAGVTKNLIHYSVIATAISYAITIITNFIGIVILYFLVGSMLNEVNQILYICVLEVFTIIAVCMFLKIKRLNNGFSFLNNNNKLEILNVTLFIVSIEVILYLVIFRKPIEELMDADLVFIFVLTGIFMAILVFMSFRSYYKSIQTQKIMDHLNTEVEIKDEKYNKLDAEHQRVTKKLHEISHQVQSFAHSINTESGEDHGDLKQQIEGLQEKLNTNSAIDKSDLPEVNVTNIDMMLCYMRSEALKNKIEFELKVSQDIQDMTDHVIGRQDLEIMIADHIKDAIIAIKAKNHEKNRKLFVQLGKFNGYYELSISDTGIEFEIDTLVHLGLKRTTTHGETGGTGIGFMSTFETLQKYNGSLVITEFAPTENRIYTKIVSMIFDGKNEYRICSCRKDDIKLKDKKDRILFLQN